MKVSVVVCTHNRCESLKETLHSLFLQDHPVSEYEVIVVDNNSTDRTKEVVSEFSQVRYVLEEKIGLSHARNRGIEESRGDIVAFIDDDAVAEKSWVGRLAQVYYEEKDAACVGGRVLLYWHAEKPSWWHPELDEVFNGINYSDSRIVLSYPRYPYGTNISFKTDILRRVGLFSTNLGRIGSKLLAGEETELCLRLEKEGHKIYYEPCAIVYHRVESQKLTKSYIRKRAFWHGRSHALIELRHFGQLYVKNKALHCFRSICWWVRRRKYPLHEQNSYFFKLGYFLQWLSLRLT